MRRRPPPTRYRRYRAQDPSPGPGLPTGATVAIAIAGIAATLIAAVASSAITGCQQSNLQDKNLKAQRMATAVDRTSDAYARDKAELRGVIDQAATRLLRTEDALSEKVKRASGSRRQQHKLDNTFSASLRAMRRSEARLKTRLGKEHGLTKAYVIAERAFLDAWTCGTKRFTPQAADYFNATAVLTAGTSIGERGRPPYTDPSTWDSFAPSAKQLDRFRDKVESRFADCR